MVTRESEQDVERDVARMQKDTSARMSSLLGGLMLSAAGLRRGGISGAVMALLGSTLFTRGFQKSSPRDVHDPYAGEKGFVEQQAEFAKSQPLVTRPPTPGATVHRRPRSH